MLLLLAAPDVLESKLPARRSEQSMVKQEAHCSRGLFTLFGWLDSEANEIQQHGRSIERL